MSRKLILPCLLLSTALGSGFIFGQDSLSRFVYLSDQRIVTLEVIDSKSVILNYINLSSSFEMIQAPMLVLLDRDQNHYNGHLISLDEVGDPNDRFKVGDLVKPGKFSGYLIMGNFQLKSPLQRAFFQVGGRILELESVTEDDFEILAARIGELDLAAEDRKAAVQRAGFSRGFGNLVFAGTEDSRVLERYFPSSEILAPVPVANPAPRLPGSGKDLADPVVVRIRATVSRQGGLRDIQLAQGIDPQLDQIALETVRNSWVFLPAIQRNEVVESEVTLAVVFKR